MHEIELRKFLFLKKNRFEDFYSLEILSQKKYLRKEKISKLE